VKKLLERRTREACSFMGTRRKKEKTVAFLFFLHDQVIFGIPDFEIQK